MLLKSKIPNMGIKELFKNKVVEFERESINSIQ